MDTNKRENLYGFREMILIIKHLSWFFVTVMICFASLEVTLMISKNFVRHFEEVIYPNNLGSRVFRLKQILRKNQNLDILIVGDSFAWCGIASSELKGHLGEDVSVMSLASGGVNVDLAAKMGNYFIVERGCDPKHVIIGFGFIAFHYANERVVKVNREMNSFAGIREIKGEEYPWDHLCFWKFRRVYRYLLLEGPPFMRLSDKVINALGPNGLSASVWGDIPKMRQREIFSKYLEPRIKDFVLKEEMFDEIRGAIRIMKSRGAKITFLFAPVHPEIDSFGYNFEPIFQPIREKMYIVARQEGINFIDCRRLPFLDHRHFFDLVHLNREGAILFSRWLAGKIPME